MVSAEMLWKNYVYIMAQCTFDLINSKSTYIFTLLNDIPLSRKSSFTEK